MYMFEEEMVRKLLEHSRRLHAELVKSPLWSMISEEPVIVNWTASLDEMEKELGNAAKT